MTRTYTHCPRAKSHMTPCIARDGRTALADKGCCVACGVLPLEEIAELGKRYASAKFRSAPDPDTAADLLTELVAAYIESDPKP